MIGGVESLVLPSSGLTCITCARPLASCACTAADLEAAVRFEVRGSLIDGRPARELAVGSTVNAADLCSWCFWRRRRSHEPDRRICADDPGDCPCECHVVAVSALR